MVYLTRLLYRRSSEHIRDAFKKRFGGFQDTLRIYVKGGAGGMGLPSLGGQGGDGGDVVLVTSSKMTLRKLQMTEPTKRFTASNGVNSRERRLAGIRGVDRIVSVPSGVTVVSDDGQVIADLDQPGKQVVVAKGGKGGCAATEWNGQKGERKSVKLDLKLIADIGLVGFPNAGKSTLLGGLSRTKPKIADYPFTTVKPQIGIIHYDDNRQISMADLPGLVEGAHLNIGMGHMFLKHVERTKLLLFIIDVHGFQLSPKYLHRTAFETLSLLNRELELYKPELISKPAILAINKLDTEESQEKLQPLLEKLQQCGDYSDLPQDIAPSMPIKFKEILQISAKESTGLEPLKTRIRELLDKEADEERENDRQELLQSKAKEKI
ncbi:GTP-binding protein 10-like [Saccoglossus kowalevskii]|uniref:GTP-binding protein 10-like n=1 Tax=Saccoglossus kowalevskii TaxID=10224 RepID=A0ABM0GTV5_SACKO|nr:PREDICTED: GTP-binding protein 10-like [Saccoglossus kowalevskii]